MWQAAGKDEWPQAGASGDCLQRAKKLPKAVLYAAAVSCYRGGKSAAAQASRVPGGAHGTGKSRPEAGNEAAQQSFPPEQEQSLDIPALVLRVRFLPFVLLVEVQGMRGVITVGNSSRAYCQAAAFGLRAFPHHEHHKRNRRAQIWRNLSA